MNWQKSSNLDKIDYTRSIYYFDYTLREYVDDFQFVFFS